MPTIFRIDGLPEGALEAAAAFHREWAAEILRQCGKDGNAVAIVLPKAPYDHRDWRLAAVRDLARRATPVRVNMVAGDDPAAIDATLRWLGAAPGITGQLMPLAPAAYDAHPHQE